jgi:hypothetical protein
MLKPQGYATIFDPDAPVTERDTITCGHCSKIVFVKPGAAATVYLIQHRDGRWTEEAGAFCRLCMRPVCLSCHDHGICVPLERLLSNLEGSTTPTAVSFAIHRSG